MKKILNSTIYAVVIFIFLSISSCSLFQAKETETSRKEIGSRTVEKEKEPEKEEEAEAAKVEPQKKKEKESYPALVPREGKTEEVLAALPNRVADFLRKLKKHCEDHNWDWLLARAESEDFRSVQGLDDRSKESYISSLLGFGESLETEYESWPEYIEPIHPNEIDRLEYTAYEKEFISYLVGGILIDKKGNRFPFAVEILGELEEILISTIKP